MKPSGTSLWEACCTSLEEAKHVFARRDWGRKDLIEGVVRAAAEGKLDILEWLCAEGEELGMSDLVNSQSEVLGVSPLYVAARRGHLQVIEWLVGHGARLNEKNEAGRTALHAAAEGGHEDVVALLLTCGADANCSDNSGWTALGYASVAGHIDVVKQLVAHGGGGTDNETKTATGKGGGRSEIANYSEYLIDPGDIQLESSLRDGVGGVWLGSPVEVKMVKREDVLDTLDRWSTMRHPHVVRLYGVCHVDGDGEPFFVYERAPFGSLVDYLDATRNEITSESLWTKLHEAALGLQYLHDRNIVHGNLNCDSIVVTANGVAKLRNIHRDITGNDDYLPWSAPELLLGSPPSFEADIYAFGMIIAQSFQCQRSMWRSQVLGLRDAIISGNLPDKPATITANQWELVKQMCCYKPKNRLSVSIVVRELEMLIHGRRSKDSASESSTEAIPTRWTDPSTACVAGYNSTVSSTLAAIVSMCSGSTATDRMYRDLYERLIDVFKQFLAPCNTPTIDIMQRYSRILHYFHKKLKTADTASSAKTTSFAASRQVADDIFTVHGEVDFFMDRVELSREANVHEWRGLWELRCQQRQQEVAETLSNLPEFLNGFESEHEREEALAYVQFEQDLHSKVHTVKDQRFGNIDTTEQLTGAHLAISYLRSTKIDSWFVPEYDIEFDSYDAYSDDINGSKHRGKWRRAQVLVRKLKLTATLRRNDQEVFKANIKIWHKLRHPHIVQVFGACHVNPPFFVCEYVSGEQLSDFLRMHPDEVWNKLYEAALGLQYLHDKQVVHGDLRCSNILVGGDGSAKLSDFGFSMLDPEVSASGKPELKSGDKPNLEWRAPEVLQGEKATFASDIYSFGMCILEVVSGQYPADSGDDVYELVKQMCQYSPSDRISVFNVVDWFEKRSGSCCGPQLYFGKSLDELDKIPGDGDDEAKREAAESGCSSLLCDLTANMSRSTTSSASDFGIPDAIMTSNTPSTTKTWFIDQKDITFSSSKAFGSGGFAKVYHGTWRQAPVVLRRVRIQNEKDLATFLNEVKIWHKLRHPHIVQLFGACHIGQPFFVCEYAAGGELSDYLRVNPDEVWNKLYEAALGLQYLHDKQVMHGDIKGNNILVGRDGSAKLSDFGFSTLESNDSATSAIGLVSGDNPKLGAIRWRSPEVLRGDKATLKSDIYSFGMCILEAVSGKRPWFGIDYDVSVRYHVKEQLLPQRPENCGEDVYELVKQMCRFHPSDRIPISDVVRKLEILQHKHAPQPCVAVDSREVHVDAMPLSWSNLGDVEVSLFPIKDILAEMSTICSSLTGVDLMDRDVCDRLDDVFKQLQSRHGTATKEVVQRFGQLLLLVHQRLKRTSTSASVQASRHTASRQRADITSSVHEDLDLFMDMAMLCRSAEVHKWRELLLLRQKQQQQEMLTKLENFPELLGDITSAEEREDVLAYLRFELRTHPSSYLPVAKGAKTNVMHDETGMVPQFSSSMKLPKWFIPEYEVQFDSFGEFGQGSFGAVYRGRWMGADVVVKSVELFDPSIDRETPSSSARLVFESEVGIWYSLHHPNIIQLFGACHIRTTFFVSEYAGGGQLDNYSREHPDEVWTKLHEAALGLRYLHSHSIVHGDLKGNNILIGNDRCAKLTDFGLSFMSDTSESNLRVMTTGAVRWMAPEVLRGEQATLASDIYSFGMCILEAQSGEVPWGRKLPDLAVKYQVVKNKQLPSRPHNVSDEAFTLVGRVCRHDPSKRLSAQELVTALKDLRNIRRLEYRTPQSCKVVTSQDFQESSNQA